MNVFEKQNERRNGRSIEQAPICPSARLTLTSLVMSGFFTFYLLRNHFSLALVCMTGSSTNQVDYNATRMNSTLDSYNISSTALPPTDQCATGTSFVTSNDDRPGEFDWPKKLRGVMLSAFYWGYIITQLPSGWLTSEFGSKTVIAIGMLVSNVANTLIPVAARIHPYIVVVLRFIVGLGQGVVFPAMHALWGRWAPPLERSRLIPSTYAGCMLGTVAALSISGFICTIDIDNGWPFTFYIYGLVSFVWWILWLVLAYNSPDKHPRISAIEREYIERSIGPSAFKKKFPIPWRSIATSPAVWAIIIAHTCNTWGNYTILTCVPAYMKEVLRFDIRANGIFLALPYFTKYIFLIISGQISDMLLEKKIFSTTKVRKICQSIAFVIPAVFISAVGFVDCSHRYLSVVFLTITVGACGFGSSSSLINHVDIAPRFAGVIFGISNTAATLPGMVSPYIAAAITPNGTAAEWRVVFFICGAIYFFGLIVYLLCSSGEEQKWAKIEDGGIISTQTAIEIERQEEQLLQNDNKI